jgi:hypothetical protein
MTTPAIYVGLQAGFRQQPPIELYNLVAPVGEHPAGSTVSRQTLEKHGVNFKPAPAARKSRRSGGSKAAPSS